MSRGPRVLSLVPSATSIVEALGASDHLVDDDPTVVLTDSADLAGETDARVVELRPSRVEDLFDDVIAVGEAIGRAAEAERLMVDLRERYWTAVDHVNPYLPGPEVVVLEALDPLVVAGLWTPQLIDAAGARHSINDTGVAPRQIAPEDLLEVSPDRLVVCVRDRTIDETRAALDVVTGSRWWPLVPAVANGHVAILDGTTSLTWPGPALVDAFRWLVSWINDRPEVAPDDFVAVPL